MKDVRFYLEFPNAQAKKRSGRQHQGHSGNVFAGFINNPKRSDDCTEGLGSVHDYPNSPVASTAGSYNFIHKQCKRIPEKLAREIHPALFQRLDEDRS